MAHPADDLHPGADSVPEALIEAAAQMLGEVGPNSISVRDVARRAGVNHGQVHHYFGGKRGLLVAAMKKLARDHFEATNARTGGNPIPPIFALAQDDFYWRAVCRVVMEDDLELARIEIDEGVSVPRRALDATTRLYDIADDDLDFKAHFALMAAAQMGWVALEDFLMLIADVKEDDRAAVRQRAKELLEGWIDQLTTDLSNRSSDRGVGP